jgi:hypothetical protein
MELWTRHPGRTILAPPKPEQQGWGASLMERTRLRRSLLAAGMGLVFAAPSFANLAMTGAPVTMHAAPSGKSRIVQHIPANAEIDVSRCSRGWCYASWRNVFGYIPAEVVVLRPPPATWPGNELPPPVVYALPTYVTPPAWRWNGAYVGGNWGGVTTHW